MGPQGAQVHGALETLGLRPIGPLNPRVKDQWAQSRLNAAFYQEKTVRMLNKTLGSRRQAETEYQKRLADIQSRMFIAANYPGENLLEAMKSDGLKSLYDLTPAEQAAKNGAAYVAHRSNVDTLLGIKFDNPLYVTIGGTTDYASQVGKYGNVEVRYKASELASRTLFSDGNHFFYENKANPLQSYNRHRFTWYDAPHLILSRMVAQETDAAETSRLLEGTVFGGIQPLRDSEAIKVLRNPHKAGEIITLGRQAGIKVTY
jgi:hypothetical protein